MCKQAKNIAPKSIVTFSYAFCNISPALLWAQRAAVLLGALHPHKALLTARNLCKVLHSASRLRPPCACLLCAQSTRNHMWKRMKQMMQILLLHVVKGRLRYQLIRGISTKGVINDSQVREFIVSTMCIILLFYGCILNCLINNSYCESPSGVIRFRWQVQFSI